MSKERKEKKDQFNEAKKSGGKGIIVGLLTAVIVAGLAGFLLLGQGATDSFGSVKSVNGIVKIDLNKVSDGKAHFFNMATNKGTIKFFVVKSVDGVMRAAFDTCDVCYREKKGYRQEGDFMVCNNCNQKFRTDLVNDIKGGCNPAPLARRIDNQQLVINEQDILSGAWYFGS